MPWLPAEQGFLAVALGEKEVGGEQQQGRGWCCPWLGELARTALMPVWNREEKKEGAVGERRKATWGRLQGALGREREAGASSRRYWLGRPWRLEDEDNGKNCSQGERPTGKMEARASSAAAVRGRRSRGAMDDGEEDVAEEWELLLHAMDMELGGPGRSSCAQS